MKTVAAFVILAGVVLLFSTAEVLVAFSGFAYYVIGAGVVLLIISQLIGNKDRIGLHRYVRLERDAEIPAMYWYRCQRCNKKKKAASIA
ncbi:hypothetical protein [Planococcus sp. ISL-109]|uniref:hypothetical protein n=1 Tax=Planococcus sp. ISL-109 TaxID=2819166 RepID=UPI001BE7EB2B|nr:hypothetical protein [Planococcus sp. ISL-109]MBT2583951.1 hypothetical protein [Planococcus sp. ISL-109]